MATAAPPAARLILRRDMRTVRETLRRIRESDRLAPLNLFGRRSAARMLDYLDRRCCEREAVQMPVYVVAASFDGETITPRGTEAMLAVTRDVSLRGIGFTHDELFQGEYAVVTFDLLDQAPVSLLLDIRWSNLEQDDHSYMSGGRFLGIAESAHL